MSHTSTHAFRAGDRVVMATSPVRPSLFDRRSGRVVRTDSVNVHVELDGLEGLLWRFRPTELELVPRSLHMTNTVLTEPLNRAWEELKAKENAASQEEMGSDICHSIVGLAIHEEEWRVLIEFGLEPDTSIAQCRIRSINSYTYELEWV